MKHDCRLKIADCRLKIVSSSSWCLGALVVNLRIPDSAFRTPHSEFPCALVVKEGR